VGRRWYTSTVRRFVLGTAGHVDHGKTTLVAALTGVDTDRLPEEKRRGITLELGFAPWRLPGPSGGEPIEVSLIDVPGHRRLVHTMIAGASGIELVLLVVAADEGVMPQTREHLAICELLGLRRAVVAITKLDRVDPELAALAGEEVRELCEGRLACEIVACSAKTGEGLEALAEAVTRALAALPPPKTKAHAHLAIDRAFTIKGAGTVVTGTLVEGRLRVGDAVRVVGPRGARASEVRALHVHDRSVSQVAAPTRLAINLAGLAVADVARGELVTTDPSLVATERLDFEVSPALRAADLRTGLVATVHVGTTKASGRLRLFPRLEGRAEVARLRLDAPLAVSGGDRLVLRGSRARGDAGAVLAGGRVLDARPPVRARQARLAVLDALARGDAHAAARALLVEAAPRPLLDAALPGRTALGEELLRAALDSLVAKGEALRLKGHGWVLATVPAELAHEARALVRRHHAESPLERGMPLATLRQKLGERAGAHVAEEALRLAAQGALASRHGDEPLVIEGDVVRGAGFVSEGGAVGERLAAVRAELARAALLGHTERSLGDALSLTPRESKALLARLVREGEVTQASDLFFPRAALALLRERVARHFERAELLTVADLKVLTELGRRQAIPLLELLDREGLTRRVGDARARGPLLAAAAGRAAGDAGDAT
jgi:selenocysteine-specific elongation factor